MKASLILFAVSLHLSLCKNFDVSFPYIASLEHNGKHICGSSIITRYELLTAAHCVHNLDKNELKVRLGSTKRESGGSNVGIKDIHIHPNFNVTSNDDNIAILVLEHPVGYFTPPWKVKLAASDDVFEGKDALIVGWGADGIGRNFTENLMFTGVTTLDNANCSAHLKKPADKILCAYNVMYSTCKGDGGGPAVIENTLAGIISGDETCGDLNQPMTFTKIPAYRNWIEKNILSADNLKSGFDSLFYWQNDHINIKDLW